MSQLLDPRCLVLPCILFAVYVCPLEHIQAKGLDDCSLSRSSLQRNELVATDKNITNVVHPQLLRFVENRGQLVDTEGNPVPEIFYYTDAGGAKLYFHRDHVSIVFSKVASGESGISEATGTPGVEPEAHPLGPQRVSYHRIDMEFVGGGSITGPQPHVLLQGYTNYYYGHHPEGITHVPGYAELIYTDLYPQIDLRFRIVDGKLKYEFIVHPGGTVSDIRIRYNGATGIRPQIDGGMKIVSPEGYALDTAPLTYQEPGTVLQSSFMLLDGDVTFTVEKYDRNRDLIIDPWATYYGGSQDDGIRGIASDASANVFVCGGSESADFPVKQALFSSFQGGVGDAVIIKLTSVGQLSWATYYGGSGGETAFDIEAGTSGEIVVSGATGSADFPTHNPYQSTLRAYSDIFLIKLSASGTAEWATFFGGSDSEGYGYVGYDQSGNIYCAAEVESLDFPTKNAFQSAYAGGVQDIAVFKFSSTYSLEWSTYYGGSASDELSSLELDSDGNPVFAGGSASTNIPLVNPTQTQLAGPSDVIIGKMSKTGSLIWSTRYGGNAAEKALGIACGPDGIIAIAGRTRSTDLPLANPIQSVAPGGMDALVAAYDSTGSFIMGGYLGGSDDDEAFGTCFDSAGKLVVVGDTKSSDFPTVAAQQAVLRGPMDAWITRTDLNGTVDWSTYYGGSDNETARQVCPATSGGVYVGGTTLSTDFPTQNPLQSAPGGKQDLFILSISSSGGVLTPPDPPSNLTGAPFTHTKAQLSWMDNSSNETSFVIEHHDGNQNWKVVATAGVDAMSLTAIDLEADHTHYFRVKAVNSLYQSDYSNILQLTMPVFPAPADLQADSVSFASLLLRWQDQSQYEDKFVIEYKTTTTTWADMMEIAKDSTSVRASGLDFMTAYQFRVRAVEGALSSPYSNVLAVSTLEFAAPANLQAVSHSAVEVRLTWEDKTDGETGFLVEFRELGGSWGIGDTAGASTTKFLLGGLQPSTTYEFRVRALYRDLKSGTSNIAQATTLLFLNTPTNLTGVLMSESNIVLNWEDNATGETGYEIEHHEDDDDWTTIHTTSANATMFDAQGLTPRTMNRFRVRAVGDGAASGYSNIIAIETRMLPAAPLNLLASAVDHQTIRMTWQRGSENEDGFEVERKEAAGDWSLLTTAGPGDGDILDENLSITTTYWYRVRAGNDQGYSPWSNVDSATTMDIPVPDAPFGLQAKATGPSSIQLSWIMPSPSTAEAFEIERSETGDPGSFSRIPPDAEGDARTLVVDQLQPDTEYFFRIRAVNRSGPSGYSNTASARTLRSDYPSVPQNVSARALSDTTIEISWEMPGASKEDGFEIQQSRTGDENEFTRLTPDPGQGARVYTDTGLQPNTEYFYRLRAYNAHGSSPWSDVVSATTMDIPISPELLAAMDAKQALIDALTDILPGGTGQMNTLRSLLGDYPRGFDEQAASALIRTWKTTGTDQPALATEALQRYTLFEEALRASWGDGDVIPAIPGARDIAGQTGRAPAIASKNLVALALAWDEERDFLGADEPYLIAGMEDVILSLSDNLALLSLLMGSEDAAEVNTLARDIVHEQGKIQDLSASLMLSLPDYWQERMLGRYFIPAVDPLIAVFAERTEQFDVTGTTSDAEAKGDAVLASLRTDVDALGSGFSDYGSICYGLDAAYALGQTAGNPLDVFMLKLKALRPRLVDGMHDAIAHAAVPVERFLYLTSPNAIPGLGSLPAVLRDAGNAIFDPVNNGPLPETSCRGEIDATAPLRHLARQSAKSNRRGEIDATAPLRHLARVGSQSTFTNTGAITTDRDFLIELRGRVLDGDTDYIDDNFDALRRSGQGMIAEVASLQRPLLGIPPAEIYQQTDLREDYYGVLARAQLLKTRRAVLSVALADYVLGPTAQKQTGLVAEIDSIIGPLDGSVGDLADLITDVGSLITLPALSLAAADIVRDEAAGSDRCRLHFTVQNVGGGEAGATSATMEFLSDGVAATGENTFSLGALRMNASVRDSMDIDITEGVTHVVLSAILETGDRSFIDRLTLAVPLQDTTTSVTTPGRLPASCILHQNYPNPFNPSTTISYTLHQPMAVTLVITDALGREVWRAAVPAGYASGLAGGLAASRAEAERRRVGDHSIEFDASGLPPGVYFYRLETFDAGGRIHESAVQLQKMVLMR